MNSAHATFHLVYDGPALATHEINVKDLAPALIAMGELLEEANRIVNGGRVKMTVNLKGTEAGCVDVYLSVAQNFLDQAISLFSGDGITAIVNASEILSLVGLTASDQYTGLISLIRWQKNRPIKNVTKIEDGIHKIELENGEYRQVTKFELGLFKSISLRKSVETIVKVPLQKEGIDTVRFAKKPGSDDIKKAEAEHFTAPILDEEILGEPILSKEVLQLVSVTFQENNKWRFSDGNTVFYADVKDEGFLNRVANNEVAFSKGDLLEVELEKRQTLVSGSLRTEYSVLEVNNHRSAMTQISLPLHDS